MLEFLQTGKALSVLAAIGVIGIVSKLITRSLYKRLLRETENMAMTKNKNLRLLKQKLENAYRLNQNIVNTQAYLDKQLYGFKFMHISLHAWNNLSVQMVILGLLAGGFGSFMSYWYRLDSYYIILYASVGALGSLFLTFLDATFNIPLKQQRLANALLEYTDNSVFVRAVRENAVRDNGRGREFGTGREAEGTLSMQADGRRAAEPAGAAGFGFFGGSGRLRGKENLETAAGNVALQAQDEDTDDRDRILRENNIRDGLVREEEPRRLSARNLRSRNAKAEDLLRTVRNMKEEDYASEDQAQEELQGDIREPFVSSGRRPGNGKAGSGKTGSLAKNMSGKGASGGQAAGEAKEGDSPARRDIDYLKHSLDQIAASKERGRKDEDWAKNLDAEEIKVLGEIMRQYFAGS